MQAGSRHGREAAIAGRAHAQRSPRHDEFLPCVPLDPDARVAASDDADDARWASVGELEGLGVHADAIAMIRDVRVLTM